MSRNLYEASAQWANRPDDERFWNLEDLAETLSEERRQTREQEMRYADISVAADKGEVVLVGPKGNAARFNHYSFGQLCQDVGAPAGYLRSLPPDLVATNLNHGLAKLARGDDGASESCNLLLRSNGFLTLRAVTSMSYGRLWNEPLVRALQGAREYGWITPPARPSDFADSRTRPATLADILPGQENFGLSVRVGDLIAPAGVYCGDRDMFVFLVNPERVIDDGGKGLMRGVFVTNSEVGAAAYKIRTFYLENVCGNHICWNVSDVKDVKIIHRHGAIRDWGYQLSRSVQGFSNADTSREVGMIRAAKNFELGKDYEETSNFLFERRALGLSRKDIEASFRTAEAWEHTANAAPTTAWGFVHGLTRYSQDAAYAGERNDLDTAGGKILQLAYTASK